MGIPGQAWCNATVAHHQQSNDTHRKARHIFEKYATTDKAFKHQIIETIEDNYIAEIHNKHTGFMGVNNINLVHHLMSIYGKFYRTGPQGKPEYI